MHSNEKANDFESKEWLRNQIDLLRNENEGKDEYIQKLEEKIGVMQKYIAQLEKENETKEELGRNIIKTKEDLDKLRASLGDKYSKLEKKYQMLKNKFEVTNTNEALHHDSCNKEGKTANGYLNTRGNNTKIDKCIEKINNLVIEMNKEKRK